jgi:hypothetical protein
MNVCHCYSFDDNINSIIMLNDIVNSLIMSLLMNVQYGIFLFVQCKMMVYHYP